MSTIINKYQKITSKYFKDLYKANVRYVSLTESTWALSRYPIFDFSLNKRIYVT